MSESDGFGYVMSIEDQMSGPAGAEARAIKALSKEISQAEQAVKALVAQQRAFKAQGLPIDSTYGKVLSSARKELSELNRQQSELLGAPNPSAGLDFFKQALGAHLLASGLKEIASAGLRAYGELRRFILESAEFREATTIAYDVVNGKGQETFEAINKRAREVHLPVQQAHELARDLMLQGLTDTDLITATVQSQAELIRTKQLAGAEKLKSIVERSVASGHFDVRGLGGGKGGAEGSARQLAGLGINQPEFLADLARRYKTDVTNIKAMLKAGKVETEVGLAAIDEAISKGSIGKAARAKYGLEDFKTDVINTFQTIAQNVDLTSFNQSLVDLDVALGGIGDNKGPIEDMFQYIIDKSGDLIEQITLIGQDFQIATLRVEVFFAKLGNKLSDAVPDFVKNGIRSGAVQHFAETNPVVKGADSAVSAVSGVANSVLSPTGPILNPLGFVGDQAGKFIGNAIGGGLRHGINASTPEVKDAATGQIDDANKAARAAAGAHSPSRLFAELGRDMGEGLTIGFNATSVSDAVSGSVSRAASTSSRPGDTSRSGPSVSLNIDNLYVGKDHEDGDHLRPVVESALTDVIERFALELGTGG